MFQLPNIQKLRHNTIKKLEREKKEQKDLQKSNKQKINYKNMININRIKKPNSFKQVKEQYYNFELLEKEFEDFLQYQQLYTSKDVIERHIKDKTTDKSLAPFILRKEMKYLDEILTNRDKIRDR